MAKKTFNINKRSRPMSEVIQEYEGSKETIDAINIFEKDPTIESHDKVIQAIENDSNLTSSKDELMGEIQKLFIKSFSTSNIPSSYSQLKTEAKFLADLNQVSGLYMAQRLTIIRDQELYKKDGYKDFRTFIDSELTLSRSSVYNYIDIVEYFVESKRLDTEMEMLGTNRSKLIPFIPLLKSEKLTEVEKENIKDSLISKLEDHSFRELTQEAKELKIKYNLLSSNKSKKEKKDLHTSLKQSFEAVSLLNSKAANECFLMILDQLEIHNQISTKELNDLSKSFNDYISTKG